MPLLEVTDLRTYFHTRAGVARAVDGITFSVEPGEILGVVGESGCGKSVASLSIMGLVPAPGRIEPGSSIRLKGRELTELDEPELRQVRGQDVAMIFQEPMTSLNPVLRVGEQIAESLREHRGWGKKAARARAIDLLDQVGIADPVRRADAYPHQLSGGMRQRVMIAIALANEPDLLLADEPTTALDVTIQAQILELLTRLRDELGMAIVLVTHDLGVVAGTCDRAVVMYAGQIVEAGAVEDLYRRPVHPYTEGLLAAVPRPYRRGGDLAVIPGTVPPAFDWPAGCRFRDRCPYRWDRCEEAPDLLPAGDQAARCWLVRDPNRRAGQAADAPPGPGADVPPGPGAGS